MARPQAEMVTNRQIILKHYVKGMVNESDFELRETKLMLQLDKSKDEVIILVKNLYLSPDPYMRTRMQPMEDPYVEPYTPGEVINGYGVFKVVASTHPEYKVGEILTGFTGWEDYSIIRDFSRLRKVPQDIGLPLSYFLGVLGMPGQTAYAGFYKVALPRLGDQLLVSGAAGAVGQLVGQFGKLSGCYVVGVAGSQEKVKLLKEKFGFDDAFNYKEETDLKAAIKRHLPKKVDIYWENVGGKLLEAVLWNVRKFARIPVCGMISHYNVEKPEGPSNLFQLVAKSVRMEGFLVFEYEHLYDEFIERVGGFLKAKKLIYVEDITEGLENATRALIDLFEGKNIGKKIVKICDP